MGRRLSVVVMEFVGRRRRLLLLVVVAAIGEISRVVDHGHLPPSSKRRGQLATAGDHGVTVRVEPVHDAAAQP